MIRYLAAKVVLELLEDVLQAGRLGLARRHTEAEAHGLAVIVVGVLAQDDHTHLVDGTAVEGPVGCRLNLSDEGGCGC